MLEQLKTMEGNLARYDLFTSTTTVNILTEMKNFHGIFSRLSKGDLRLPVHRMELGRIRFPTCGLLREFIAEIYKKYFETENNIQAILFIQQGCFLKGACSFI